ncbi:Chromate resistance protein ChrB [Microlunatus flavus]|uniref:Chromate resistance protein ChrB n=1 Tax=Microlunatus flavus TaxID=1036181 RepID=UPI0038CC14C1
MVEPGPGRRLAQPLGRAHAGVRGRRGRCSDHLRRLTRTTTGSTVRARPALRGPAGLRRRAARPRWCGWCGWCCAAAAGPRLLRALDLGHGLDGKGRLPEDVRRAPAACPRAVYLARSTCLLPDLPEVAEAVDAAVARIRTDGGTARTVRIVVPDADEDEELRAAQRAERDVEYAEVVARTASFLEEIATETARQRFTYAEVEESERTWAASTAGSPRSTPPRPLRRPGAVVRDRGRRALPASARHLRGERGVGARAGLTGSEVRRRTVA